MKIFGVEFKFNGFDLWHSGNFDPASKAPLASPALTGTPTAPTPTTADNDTSIATTAFVKAQGYTTSASNGDVTAAANITDHSVVRGNGGAKGVQGSGVIVDDSNNISGIDSATLKIATISGVGAEPLVLGTIHATGPVYQHLVNGGGQYYIGVANSVGGGLGSGGTPYSLQLVTESARDIQLATNNACRVTIDSAGVVSLLAGQIKFPAAQNASADANTLDDYEEGVFAPTITFGGASVGITYTTQWGTYVKIGKTVSISIYITISNKGSSVGAAHVIGLPFVFSGYYAVTIHGYLVTYVGTLYALGVSDVAEIYLRRVSEAGDNNDVTQADFSNGCEIILTTSYKTTA